MEQTDNPVFRTIFTHKLLIRGPVEADVSLDYVCWFQYPEATGVHFPKDFDVARGSAQISQISCSGKVKRYLAKKVSPTVRPLTRFEFVTHSSLDR